MAASAIDWQVEKNFTKINDIVCSQRNNARPRTRQHQVGKVTLLQWTGLSKRQMVW
jgi:hypothetical protein